MENNKKVKCDSDSKFPLVRLTRLKLLEQNDSQENPMGKDGYRCHLPIPFVEGVPTSIDKMNIDQLRTFIRFAYNSQYKKQLSSAERRPIWWPKGVAFNKSLNLTRKNPKTSETKIELINLVQSFYRAYGMTVLLMLAQEMTGRTNSVKLQNGSSKNKGTPWEIVQSDESGKLVLVIDHLTRTYDQETNYKSHLPTKKVEPRRGNAVSSSNSSKSTTRAIMNVSNLNRKPSSKRKLFEMEHEAETKSHTCRFCAKKFKLEDFCGDHESQCMKGPNGSVKTNIDSFMAVLGMDKASGSKTECRQETSASNLKTSALDSNSTKKRPTRKVTRRYQLGPIIKIPSIPISSDRGQRLIKEVGPKFEHKYPLPYESFCQSRTAGLKHGRRNGLESYPNNAKKSIEKDGENPHIYSYGKRHRELRNQELVIGLNSRSWKSLNKCRKPLLRLEKVDEKSTVTSVPDQVRPCFSDNLGVAMKSPRIELFDIKLFPTAETKKYLDRLESKS